jgi:hypothetical protein
MALIVRNFQGGLKLQNKSGADEASIDLKPGRLIVDSTVSGGAFIVKGVGPPVDDQSTGTATVNEDALVSPESVSDAVWDEIIAGHVVAGSAGALLSSSVSDVSLTLKHLGNRLKVDIDAQQLVLYDDDGTTVLRRWPVTTYGGEDVQTQTGVQVERGKPL